MRLWSLPHIKLFVSYRPLNPTLLKLSAETASLHSTLFMGDKKVIKLRLIKIDELICVCRDWVSLVLSPWSKRQWISQSNIVYFETCISIQSNSNTNCWTKLKVKVI